MLNLSFETILLLVVLGFAIGAVAGHVTSPSPSVVTLTPAAPKSEGNPMGCLMLLAFAILAMLVLLR